MKLHKMIYSIVLLSLLLDILADSCPLSTACPMFNNLTSVCSYPKNTSLVLRGGGGYDSVALAVGTCRN